MAHPADYAKFSGSVLYALYGVNDNEGAVNSREATVGIFGKVCVSRGVKQVDSPSSIAETHDRGAYRNTAFLLHCHEVGNRRPLVFTAFYRPCDMYCTAEEEEFLGDCGLARIRMGDDCKSESLMNFLE